MTILFGERACASQIKSEAHKCKEKQKSEDVFFRLEREISTG